MRGAVTLVGPPVVTAGVGAAGPVVLGHGPAPGGHDALRAAGLGPAAGLELRDAPGARLPTDARRVLPTPSRRHLVVRARLGRGAVGVARLVPSPGSGTAARGAA